VNGATSVWQPGNSDAPQDSVLGLVLLNTFINGLDAGLTCVTSKFADDTKLGGSVESFEGQEALQRDLDRLEHWAIIKWIKFIDLKYQILHLGWSNARHKYKLERSGCRAALQKGIWGCWSTAGSIQVSSVSWQTREQTASWAI